MATNAPFRARIARKFGFLRNVAGWRRIANRLSGSAGRFEVVLPSGARLSGDLASFIDREAFLFGGYERNFIELFLRRVPRGGTILDIGANIGNHSAIFSRHFDHVIAFEPNPAVLPELRRNAELNGKIEVMPIGLGDAAGDLPLHSIDNANGGLATFSQSEQYDKPLEQIGVAHVAVADELLAGKRIAAVKVDVQGYEPQVLRGMHRLLEINRPLVWMEVGAGTLDSISIRSAVEALFPYPVKIERFESRRAGLRYRAALERYDADDVANGDYLVTPA